ncbi:hypothetical protein ACHAXR_012075 [Thalassiosira sp. AJA248-18]
MHLDVVKISEEKFYGYYPEGFKDFNLEKFPTDWTAYSVDKTDNTRKCENGELTLKPTAAQGSSSSIWDTFLNLDELIVPPPFQSTDLARVSQTPILTPEECCEITSECENHYWGWGSSNERYSTPANRVGHMMKLEELSFSYTFVNFTLLPRLFPAISTAFPDRTIKPEDLRLGGCRVVKYDAADGHVELGMHRDGLFVTANIALNDLESYEGGGTIVEGLCNKDEKRAIRLKKGHVLLHPGDVKHGGAPITSGIRYTLVCFILDTTFIPHEKYCQDRMKIDIEAARELSLDDEAQMEERDRLLTSAARHCADAYAFGKLACSGELSDGYDDIIECFGSLSSTNTIDNLSIL